MKSKKEQAWKLAKKVHKKQTRFDGNPYIIHPTIVVEILKEMGVTNEKVIITAILHDTIEDGESWVTEEIFMTFGREIGYLVKVLSHTKEQSYDDYIKNIMLDRRALIIKIADIIHNVTDNPTTRMRLKYRKVLTKLIGKLMWWDTL